MDGITPAQCRAARALLNLKQSEIAEKSGITERTIAEFERNGRTAHLGTVSRLHATFAALGIKFLVIDGLAGCVGPAVDKRLDKPKTGRPKTKHKVSSKRKASA